MTDNEIRVCICGDEWVGSELRARQLVPELLERAQRAERQAASAAKVLDGLTRLTRGGVDPLVAALRERDELQDAINAISYCANEPMVLLIADKHAKST